MVYLWNSLALLVFRGAQRGNQGCITATKAPPSPFQLEISRILSVFCGGALLVFPKTKLFATHQASPSKWTKIYSRKVWVGFPESP
jgi:hypothetical protein